MENQQKVPDILGGPGGSFRERIEAWNVGNISANNSPRGDDDMEVDANKETANKETGGTGAESAAQVENEENGPKTADEKDANEPQGTDGDDEEVDDLRKKALETIPSKKRDRPQTTESDVANLLATSKAAAEVKKAKMEMDDVKSRRMMLYLPDFKAKFGELMAEYNCLVEKKFSAGEYDGKYKALQMEQEARWDRTNKCGQIYPVAGADTAWMMTTLNEMLLAKQEESYFEYHLYLYSRFVDEWDVAILLLNGSALVSLEYDREKVLAYLRRNLGELAGMDESDWRLISISQPRYEMEKAPFTFKYTDKETGEEKQEKRERLTKVRKGNAVVTLHLKREAAEKIKSEGDGMIPFQHGKVKVKWGNPDIIFSTKDPISSANNTPLGNGRGGKALGSGRGALSGGRGAATGRGVARGRGAVAMGGSPRGAKRERRFVEKPHFRAQKARWEAANPYLDEIQIVREEESAMDADNGEPHTEPHTGEPQRPEPPGMNGPESVLEVIIDYTNELSEWTDGEKVTLDETIEKYRYLEFAENDSDADNISVRSYRSVASNVSSRTLSKGQKKNRAQKRKTLSETAKRIRGDRMVTLEELLKRFREAACDEDEEKERDQHIADIEKELKTHKAKLEGPHVIMEHD